MDPNYAPQIFPILMGLSLFVLVMVILVIAAIWKLFQKAGKPGWAAIVPIYNSFIQLEIANKPTWWIIILASPYLLRFFPLASLFYMIQTSSFLTPFLLFYLVVFVFSFLTIFDFVKAYGKDIGWAIGCLFLPFIFYPIMAWNKNIQYIGNGDALNVAHDPSVLDNYEN